MIKSLKLTNFKSIGKTLIAQDDSIEEGKLEFAPLTIFCGKNSSGKSSALQSILLLSQTLKNEIPEQSLVLNGPMVKLGSLENIKTSYIKEKNITFDIDFSFAEPSNELNKIVKDYIVNSEEKKNHILEEEIVIEKYGKLLYSLSNDISEIEEALLLRTGCTINIDNSKWKENNVLHKNVKKLMNKHDVNYSTTITKYPKYNHIIINKRNGNIWEFISYYETDGFIFDSNNKIMYNKFNQNTNLKLSFFNDNADAANIFPVINHISIHNSFYLYKDYSYFFKAENLNVSGGEFETFNFNFDNITNNIVKKNTANITKDYLTMILKLNHFIPEYILNKKIIDDVVASLLEILFNKYLKNEYIYDSNSINEFNNSIILLLEHIGNSEIESKIKSQCLLKNDIKDIDTFKENVSKSISLLIKFGLKDYLRIIAMLLKERENNMPLLNMKNVFGFSLSKSLYNIYCYLKNNILYIGPLREEPHLQYEGYNLNSLNIGIKGENCAGVMYHNRNKFISFFSPDIFKQEKIKLDKNNNLFLNTVIDWLKYIGVAKSLEVNFNSRYGYEIKIAAEGNNNNDLTNVGVGVSQVLPIVIACLLAQKETTIIIEQPELHLHPSMQSKLTDFFIATMLCDKQLIIETHSEHIINRLRLRTVKTPTGVTIFDKLKIYFSESLLKDTDEFKKGNTIFKPIKINEYGAISDWPDGFFDQSQLDREEIIDAVGEILDKEFPDE